MSGLVLYGGAFDPPHRGHDHCARRLIAAGAGRLVLVPSGVPPHKPAPDTTPQQRLAWARAWAATLPGEVEVLDVEIRGTLSGVTADLVIEVAARHPGEPLWIAVGTDQLNALPRWQRPDELLARAGVLALERRGIAVDPEACAWVRERTELRLLDGPAAPEVSSTGIRALLAAGDLEAARRDVAPGVELEGTLA